MSDENTLAKKQVGGYEATGSLIGAYLKDIRQVPLLKPEEELALAKKVAKGVGAVPSPPP